MATRWLYQAAWGALVCIGCTGLTVQAAPPGESEPSRDRGVDLTTDPPSAQPGVAPNSQWRWGGSKTLIRSGGVATDATTGRFVCADRQSAAARAIADAIARRELAAYRRGVEDARLGPEVAFSQRGLVNHKRAMAAGHAAFEAGEYSIAAREFLLAAMLNQGDPTSRLCAAHAQTALGNYSVAAGLLRRAVGLQPRLAYMPLDVRDAYGKRSDFAEHTAALQSAVEQHADDADLQFLLGYYYFFSGRLNESAPPLLAAQRLKPDDRSIRVLADAVQMMTGAAASNAANSR